MCMLIKVHKAPINNIRIKSALKDHNTTVDECIIYSTETAKPTNPNKPQRQIYQDKNNK